MSSAGSAGRRGGATYAAYQEPKPQQRPSAAVDAMLILSGFVIVVTLLLLVAHIG